MNTTLAGTMFPNDDGSSRQENLEECMPGDPIMLELEDDNPHDKKAIMVVAHGGGQVGYIPGKFAAELRRRLDFPYQAEVVNQLGTPGNLNVIISITFSEGK